MNENFIQISNNGQAVAATNYFDSSLAAQGGLFLSWNAGAGRLLIPDSQKSAVREMRAAEYVIVTSGRWEEHGIQAVELLFEDHSDAPLVLTLPAVQCDRMLNAGSAGTGFYISVWTRGGQKVRLPGRFRHGRALPCLEAWGKN